MNDISPSVKNDDILLNTIYDMKITKTLLRLGIHANCSGYKYLRDSIMLACLSPNVTGYVTKTLYPTLGKIHKVNTEIIARTCLRAINTAYTGKNNAAIIKYFSSKGITRKPTCGEFISKIAETVRLEAAVYESENIK